MDSYGLKKQMNVQSLVQRIVFYSMGYWKLGMLKNKQAMETCTVKFQNPEKTLSEPFL